MAMKSRKSAGKSAAKSRAARPPSARPPARPKRQRAMKGAERLFSMSMGGLGNTLERLNLSGVAGTIAEGRRKDLAAIVAANKKSYEGLQAVVARQTSMLKNAVTEWQSIAQGVSAGGAGHGPRTRGRNGQAGVHDGAREHPRTRRTRGALAGRGLRDRAQAHHGKRQRSERVDAAGTLKQVALGDHIPGAGDRPR